MPIGTPPLGGSSKPSIAVPTASSQTDNASASSAPTVYAHWGLLGVVAMFALFVVVIQHDKIKNLIKPANIAFNIWNLFVIFITVVVSFTLFKVAAIKYAAAGLPGGTFLVQLAGTV